MLDLYETVLVTGGCGFIGSHLTETLLEMGKRVLVLDNLTSGFEHNPHSTRFSGAAAQAHIDSLPR